MTLPCFVRLEWALAQLIVLFSPILPRPAISTRSFEPAIYLGSFLGPVINQRAFDKITKAMDAANKDDCLETIVGGTYDGSKGLYIEPTIYSCRTPDHPMFDQELFDPVLVAYVYPDGEFDSLSDTIDEQGGRLALTGSIFTRRSHPKDRG